MTIEKLRELYNATPFRPFTIHLADGHSVPVISREFVAAAPSGRTVVVLQPDDSMSIIDLLLVTRLEVNMASNGHGKRRKA